MYTVYVDDNLLYHPNLVQNGFSIYGTELKYELNKSGSFKFTMPPSNNVYNKIKKMSSIITVYSDGKEIFRGRVLNDEKDFYNNKQVYCEGELAFLLDSIVRPFNYDGTIDGLFRYLINTHNQEVDSFKRFTAGECTVEPERAVKISVNEYLNSWNCISGYLLDTYGGYLRIRLSDGIRYIDYISSYNSTNDQVVSFGNNILDIDQYISAESVFTKLIPLGATYPVEVEDAEITPGIIESIETEPIGNRAGSDATEFMFKLDVLLNSKSKETGKSNITINYYGKATVGSVDFSGLDSSKIYADIQIESEQKVKTGLKNKSLNSSYSLLSSWTGDVETTTLSITGEFVNRYTNKDKKPISNSMSAIARLLQQKYLYTNISTATGQDGRDYITADQNILDLFGTISKVNYWDDITDPEELLSVGKEYLNNNTEMSVTLNINAVDLNLLNVAYDRFKLGDMIRVVSAPHGIDSYFLCSSLSLDLQNPDNNVYSLGSEFKSLTEQHVNVAKEINITTEQISQVYNDLDSNQKLTEEVQTLVDTIYDKYTDVVTVINNLDVAYADIDFANIDTAAIANLIANTAFIAALNAKYAEIDMANIGEAAIQNLTAELLSAGSAFITELNAKFAQLDFANITEASINNLTSNLAFISKLSSNYAEIDFANITDATIQDLLARQIVTQTLNASYANISLGNVTQLNAASFFAASGLISNASIVNAQITGDLNALRINGDLITAGTLKADRLIIEGSDGFYYKLNVMAYNDGKITDAEWERIEDVSDEALHGANIIARSITADRIAANSITTNELSANIASDLGITALNVSVGNITTTVSSLEDAVSGFDEKIRGSIKRIDSYYLTTPIGEGVTVDLILNSGDEPVQRVMHINENSVSTSSTTTITSFDGCKIKDIQINGASGVNGTYTISLYSEQSLVTAYSINVGSLLNQNGSSIYKVDSNWVLSSQGTESILEDSDLLSQLNNLETLTLNNQSTLTVEGNDGQSQMVTFSFSYGTSSDAIWSVNYISPDFYNTYCWKYMKATLVDDSVINNEPYILEESDKNSLNSLTTALQQTKNSISLLAQNVSNNYVRTSELDIGSTISSTVSTILNDPENPYVRQSQVEQTANNLIIRFSNDNKLGDLSKLAKYFEFDGETGLTIGALGSGMRGVFTNEALNFVKKISDSEVKAYAWISTGEGLGGKELSVGNADIIANRWRIFATDDGTHLRFTRHT